MEKTYEKKKDNKKKYHRNFIHIKRYFSPYTGHTSGASGYISLLVGRVLEKRPKMDVIGLKNIFSTGKSNVEISMGLIKILIYLAIIVGFIVFFAVLINFVVRFF